ncbi:hypothetical protein J6590_021071 [Homalodisca vitripennis]|nr:hypothetical protein J6590_021071 [Homalodisca vitripennis]
MCSSSIGSRVEKPQKRRSVAEGPALFHALPLDLPPDVFPLSLHTDPRQETVPIPSLLILRHDG